jgi:hypothetical protein
METRLSYGESGQCSDDILYQWRVAGGDDLDSMLRFRLERKCDGIKHC